MPLILFAFGVFLFTGALYGIYRYTVSLDQQD
jgi:hypothetical protein